MHQGLVVPQERAVVDDTVLHHRVRQFPLVLWRDDGLAVAAMVLEQGGDVRVRMLCGAELIQRRHCLPNLEREYGRLVRVQCVLVALNRLERGVVVALQAMKEALVQARERGDRNRAGDVAQSSSFWQSGQEGLAGVVEVMHVALLV